MTTLKTKLLANLRQDNDFNKFDDTILKDVIENLEIENYFLDKQYQDISYIIIEGKIINSDEIYFLCRDFND
jgi:hypothetical protein